MILSALLPQYYLNKSVLPREILLPCEIEGAAELAQILTERAGRKVTLHVPQRGEKAELLAMAQRNAREDVERRVYDLLAELNIPFTRVDHEEAHDMDACVEISRVLGVDICKNLLLTPRNRSTFYLLCLPGDKPFLTKDFSKQIGSSRLSFATAEDLQALLGVQPGSASVLGLMNDPEHRVQLCFDRPVIESEWFGCHPCRNTSSLRLKTRDVLDVFLKHTGHTATVVDL